MHVVDSLCFLNSVNSLLLNIPIYFQKDNNRPDMYI